jgi:hypothetical protein
METMSMQMLTITFPVGIVGLQQTLTGQITITGMGITKITTVMVMETEIVTGRATMVIEMSFPKTITTVMGTKVGITTT